MKRPLAVGSFLARSSSGAILVSEVTVLGTHEATATIAVKDLDRACLFYEEKLGLTRRSTEGQEAVLYNAGRSGLLVYRSDYAGTNKATAATWTVDRVDDLVRELQGKGVRFERYDFPDCTHEGDVHVMGSLRVAWFKDPEGNIHSIVNH
jgi:predicted enzyme related to lactoylglutathione lyase